METVHNTYKPSLSKLAILFIELIWIILQLETFCNEIYIGYMTDSNAAVVVLLSLSKFEHYQSGGLDAITIYQLHPPPFRWMAAHSQIALNHPVIDAVTFHAGNTKSSLDKLSYSCLHQHNPQSLCGSSFFFSAVLLLGWFRLS